MTAPDGSGRARLANSLRSELGAHPDISSKLGIVIICPLNAAGKPTLRDRYDSVIMRMLLLISLSLSLLFSLLLLALLLRQRLLHALSVNCFLSNYL